MVGEIALLNKFKTIHFFDENVNEIEKFPFKVLESQIVKKKVKIIMIIFVSIHPQYDKTRHKKIEWLKK